MRVRHQGVKCQRRCDLVLPTFHQRKKWQKISALINTPRDPPLSQPIIDKRLIRQEQPGIVDEARRAAHRHKAIGLGAGRQRGKPTVANRIVAGEEIEYRHLRGHVIAHHQALVGGGRLPLYVAVDKAVHRMRATRHHRRPDLNGDRCLFVRRVLDLLNRE